MRALGERARASLAVRSRRGPQRRGQAAVHLDHEPAVGIRQVQTERPPAGVEDEVTRGQAAAATVLLQLAATARSSPADSRRPGPGRHAAGPGPAVPR